jgi:2-oxoglutarate ferredoxin oxidoreductase subunit delta
VLCELGGEEKYTMAGKIIIDTERCKGCGLCVVVCAKAGIVISKKSNKSGYFPAEAVNSDSFDKLATSCTGCAVCAIVCPDAAIEVFCESKVVDVKSNKKGQPNLIKEKT